MSPTSSRRQFIKQSGQGALAVLVTTGAGTSKSSLLVSQEQRDPLFCLGQQLGARIAAALALEGDAAVTSQAVASSNAIDLLLGGLHGELNGYGDSSTAWAQTRGFAAEGQLLTALFTNQSNGRQIRLQIDSVLLSHLTMWSGENTQQIGGQMLCAGACQLQWLS
jgi:hypothetical protein